MSDAPESAPPAYEKASDFDLAAQARNRRAFAAHLAANRPAGWALFGAIMALAVVLAVRGGRFILTILVLWCALWVLRQIGGDRTGS